VSQEEEGGEGAVTGKAGLHLGDPCTRFTISEVVAGRKRSENNE